MQRVWVYVENINYAETSIEGKLVWLASHTHTHKRIQTHPLLFRLFSLFFFFFLCKDKRRKTLELCATIMILLIFSSAGKRYFIVSWPRCLTGVGNKKKRFVFQQMNTDLLDSQLQLERSSVGMGLAPHCNARLNREVRALSWCHDVDHIVQQYDLRPGRSGGYSIASQSSA